MIWNNDTNLGSILDSVYFERFLSASDAVRYEIVQGEIPGDVTLGPTSGKLSGVPLVDNPEPNIPIYVYTITVRAYDVNDDYQDKIFKISLIYNGMYVTSRTNQSRVRFVNNFYQYQISQGRVETEANIYWRLAFGELPPGVTLYQNGNIEGVTNDTTVPFVRETFLKSDAPDIPELSQEAWDTWFSSFMVGQPKELDYQFVIELSDGNGPVSISVTLRISYLKVPQADSWFQDNQQYLVWDPDKYYVFIASSDIDFVIWKTPRVLDSINNGSVSDLSVQAECDTGKRLSYAIKPGYPSVLPQALIFLSNGLLSGRIGFATYIDNPLGIPENDNYEFTIRATAEGGYTYAEKTFFLHVNRLHNEPYSNIWIRAFPIISERQKLDAILNNQVLFPDRLIYRSVDPWFGRARHPRFLFLPGLKDRPIEDYYQSIADNHFNKNLFFGEVQTAVSYDLNLNVKYEVVYLPIIDKLSKIDPDTGNLVGLPEIIDLRGLIKNYHFGKDGSVQYLFKPNSLANMRSKLAKMIGFYNEGILPGWMTSVQPVPEKLGQFYAPKGLIYGIVLAYTVAGGSKLISFRIKRANINFNDFQFEFDRYELDQNLRSSTVLPILNPGPIPAQSGPSPMNTFVTTETIFDDGSCRFESGTTRFDLGLDVGDEQGPYAGNKYIKYPQTGAFT